MARDIEEFLRQAAQRRQEKLRQRQQPGQAPKPASPPEGSQQRRPETPGGSEGESAPGWRVRTAPKRQDEEIHIIDAETADQDRSSGSIQDHVQSYIDTSDISSHAEQVGDRLETVDEQVESRIHATFDHGLGGFENATAVSDDRTFVDTSDEVTPLARDLFKLLSDPHSIRQAILLREIFDRPKFMDE